VKTDSPHYDGFVHPALRSATPSDQKPQPDEERSSDTRFPPHSRSTVDAAKRNLLNAINGRDRLAFILELKKVPASVIRGAETRVMCWPLLMTTLEWLAELARDGDAEAGETLGQLLDAYPWLARVIGPPRR